MRLHLPTWDFDGHIFWGFAINLNIHVRIEIVYRETLIPMFAGPGGVLGLPAVLKRWQ